MKKYMLLLLFAMITGIYGYSQSLSLSDSTGPVANNSVQHRMGHVNDDVIICYFFVTNNTSQAINVIVKKVEINMVSGTTNTFCWGVCFPPSTFVSPPKSVPGMTTDSTDFLGEYSALGNPGTSQIRYVFFDEANPTDSVCVNVYYDAFGVGVYNQVAKNILGSAYPNPANSNVSFNYSINSGEAGSVIIRNVLGSKIKEMPLVNSEGKLTLPVDDLPNGIYFYSLNLDGKAFVTRKLIIKH